MTAVQLAGEAVAAGCSVVCAAYNEPMVSAEWTRDVFAAARRRGLLTALISDGHSRPEVVRYRRGVSDVLRVGTAPLRLSARELVQNGYRRLPLHSCDCES
jgi:pyruvate formate lyase activating enzyme